MKHKKHKKPKKNKKNKKNKITLPALGRVIEAEAGLTLREALTQAGIFLESPCGGAGKCGKCAAEILSGPVPDPTAADRAALSPEELARPLRLACRLIPAGDLSVKPPSSKKEADVLTAGLRRDWPFDPPLTKKPLAWPGRGPAHDHRSLERLFADLTGAEIPACDINIRRSLAALNSEGRPADLAVIREGAVPLAVEAEPAGLYGLAADIGTTTIAASLIDLGDGRELGSRSLINPQTRQGLDVISRLTYCAERGEAGTAELRDAVTGALNELGLELAREQGAPPSAIRLVAAAANTAMLHLLTGVSPVSLGAAPFAPVFTQALNLPGFGPGPLAGARLYTLPSVSAYIGADIVAGAFVCDLAHKDKTLFIDLGTNGEIVLAAGGRLLACSCAAGPALEGMNIQFGMRAAEGAVEEATLRLENAGLRAELNVIGGGEPIGFCGSGLLAVLREFLRLGLIRRDGRLLSAADLPAGDPRRAFCRLWDGRPALGFADGRELCLTQKDVRQAQLAKGAILSAFRALLSRAGLALADLESILVAGQFGHHLAPASLTDCGLVPQELGDRLEYVGNASLAGARLAMTSVSARAAMEELAGRIDYFELALLPGYDRLFTDSLRFPDPPGAVQT